MFRYLAKKIRVVGNLFKKRLINESEQNENKPKEKIPASVKIFDLNLKKAFNNCSNFVRREIALNGKKIVVAYIEGFIDYQRLDDGVIKPILDKLNDSNEKQRTFFNIAFLKNIVLLPCDLIEIEYMQDVEEYMYGGYCVLFIDNESKALGVSITETNKRDVAQPTIDNTIRGPKEAFGESATVNLTLITKIIRNPQLKSELIFLGDRTRTKIYICYIDGIAKQKIIDEVKQRLARIKVDAILETNYITEYIADNPYTVFPLAGSHERPDIVVAQLLEGRIALLCNGAPLVITVPYIFIECIQNSEDYFNKPLFASIIRIIRLVAFTLTLLLPALYISFLNFHHEVIPFELQVTAAAGQEKIPLSSLLEVLVLLAAFELLREASMRMPKGIGQTISIVGALVLGDAAVKAGFVSNLVVIIIALTAICSFINSSLLDTVSILRVFFVIVAEIFGFTGVMFLLAIMFFHMCSLTSFSMPYMSPLAPWNAEGAKDALVRFPFRSMKLRPKGMAEDKKRRSD